MEDSSSPKAAGSAAHAGPRADVLEERCRDASSLRVQRFAQQDTLQYDGDAEALEQWNIVPLSEVVGAKRKAEMIASQRSHCTASETSGVMDALPPDQGEHSSSSPLALDGSSSTTAGPRRRFRLSRKQPAAGAQTSVSSGSSSVSQGGRMQSASEELGSARVPDAKALPKAFSRSQTSVLRERLGHDLTPPEQGTEVLVHGDGWGGGRGEYAATVTEADSLTFTVIYQNGPRAWEETHVLRSFCTSHETQIEITREAKRRRAGRSARSP